MRCPRCGNENSEGNRFCGMCGATLVGSSQTPVAAPAGVRGEKKAESATGRLAAGPGSSARPAPVEPAEPAITGPSFLGLNKPMDGQRSGGRDLGGRSSGSVDYLLDDDEDEPRRGWGKLLLVLFALVLAGAFGYLHWRQGGFDWVMNGRKPAPAAEESQSTPASGAASSSSTPDSTASNPAASNSASANPSNQPATNDGAGAATPAAATGTTSAAPANSQPPAAPAASTQPSPAETETAGNSAKPSTDKSADATNADDDSAPSNSESAEAARPDASVKKLRKPTPATPVDVTAEAERYIYGSGVRQDCDRGLRLLKSATAQSNPKAMVTMGTLYSTGTCTPRDLPTAYRWFAMALHKQPDNQALQDDLQQLWGKMTQPERQLAIKLSQ